VSVVQLFAACVAIWGTTWIAITFQLGPVSPEASVLYRYVLASALLFAFCYARRLPLRYTRHEHAWIALQGVLMFSVSYVLVYHAELYVVSGLVAMGYSAGPLLSMIGMRAFYGTPMRARIGIGSVLGIVGIALVFATEFAHLEADLKVAIGAALTAAAVIVSTFATLVAHRNHAAGIPHWQNMAWGMLYGALFTLLIVLALGRPLDFPGTPAYVGSLVYLAVFGSILAFAAYLRLLAKIGPAPAGYIGVMIPLVALTISSLFEGYRWSLTSLAGVAVAVAGNAIILRRPAAKPA
jgi:drug/metabolite transporter (DMT)-like permease